MVMVDVDQSGGGDGRGGQGGLNGDHLGLGGQGDDVGATETYQAGRRGEGGCVIGTRREAVRKDVSLLI